MTSGLEDLLCFNILITSLAVILTTPPLMYKRLWSQKEKYQTVAVNMGNVSVWLTNIAMYDNGPSTDQNKHLSHTQPFGYRLVSKSHLGTKSFGDTFQKVIWVQSHLGTLFNWSFGDTLQKVIWVHKNRYPIDQLKLYPNDQMKKV